MKHYLVSSKFSLLLGRVEPLLQVPVLIHVVNQNQDLKVELRPRKLFFKVVTNKIMLNLCYSIATCK